MKTKKQKLKSYLLAGTVLLTVGGTGAVLAQSNGVKLFDAPLRSLPALPDGGTVNYSFSGTGSAVWSNGEATAANFMKVNDQTTFCLEPFTEVFEGANATKAGQDSAAQKQWKAMTQYQRDLINNITYIGLVNNADGDPNINLATQFSLWLIEAGQNEVSGLLPKVSEVDTSKLNNVTEGKTITGLESSGADISEVVKYATTILKQAVASSQSPEFNPNPLTVIAGSSATSTDKNGVLAGKAGGYGTPFDHIQSSEGLSAKRVDNSLEVSATPSAIGKTGSVKVRNNIPDFVPHYIYGTINPDSTVGQTLFATTDPAMLIGQLAVKTIGLGQATLFKLDADTKTPEAQGAAHLENSEWGLFYADGKPVQWTDGQKDYPITKTAGEKVNDKSVVLKMTDLTQGVGVKNLDYSKDTYWQETKAPEGYELSTKKYPVHFDEKDKFDKDSKNFVEEATATDRVGTFSFMFDKAQDVHGSLTGLNGAGFTATPVGKTKGNPIKVVSKSGVDDRGYTVNGLVEFNGEANLAAGNPDKEGLAFGDYDVTEDDTPDGLQPINPFSIRTTDKKDDKGNLTGYTITFKDKVTGQVISTNDISLEQMKDNNIMIKLNLGTFTDKPIEPLNPALTSTATDKSDGDKTLGVGEAQITDKVTASGLKANTTYQLESQPVSKSDGKPLKDKDGKSSLIKQEVKTDKDGNFSVDVTSSILDTTGLQEKSITLLTKVKDSEGKVVVEDQNYKNNPTETVAVDKAAGHTEVQDKEITPETKTVTDRYFYEGLVKGNTYTVKISQAFDHNLNKVIDVDGELTFKAEDTKGTVDVPVKIDAKKYAGHKITFYEDLYKDKPDGGDSLDSNHNKDDVKETITVKKATPAPKVDTPSTPLADTGAALAQHIWGLVLAGLALVAGGITFFMKKRKSSSEK